MNKRSSTLEEISNISREIEILRTNQKEILEIKNTVKMKTNFNRFISRLDMTEERIFVLEDISVGSSKTGKKKNNNPEHNSQGLWDNCKWEYQKEKKESVRSLEQGKGVQNGGGQKTRKGKPEKTEHRKPRGPSENPG